MLLVLAVEIGEEIILIVGLIKVSRVSVGCK